MESSLVLALVLPLVAVLGVAAVAVGGSRFMDREDARLDAVAETELPALWGPATTDALIAKR